MMVIRRTIHGRYGYTVDEVARFLQYDREAVRYWLRTGHLAGRYDSRSGEWQVNPADLVSFLRQSTDPMPTGIISQQPAMASAAYEAAAG